MPCCAIMNCKNESRTKSVCNGDVSYHRFPKNPFIKEKWIDATGRQNWMPTKYSTICSEHFEHKYIHVSKKGYKYLNENAIPTQKFLVFQNQIDSEVLKPGPSRKAPQETNLIAVTTTKMAHTNKYPEWSNIYRLQHAQYRIKKQNLKIKLLQTRNRRLNKKFKKLEEILKSLQEKFAMTSNEKRN